MLGRTTGHGLSTLIVVCLVYWSLKPSATLIIDHSRYNYTTVPQNLTDQVTELLLSYNKINVIDNTSFVKYGRLKYIYLQHNNLEYIMPGTFDNNPHLKGLYLKFNDIKYLPPSFGPSAPFLEELDLGSAMKASVAEILRIQYLAQFSSLTFLRLRYIELFTLEDIFLPRPLQTLSIGNTELSTFPNVSADRLPDLEVLLVQGNLFHVIPEYLFSGISDSLHNFDISGGQLNVTPNFASKTELKVIDLRGNSLETQDDLLAELPKLKKIYLNKNSRWTCDKRLCWWRLWGRVRQEIKFDKPQCVNPAWTENYILPEINPKFMDCFNDSRFTDLFTGTYYDLVHHTKNNHGNCTVTIGSYRKDFNYDLVLEQAAHGSFLVRSRLECTDLCFTSSNCYGIIFNSTALPHGYNCVFLGQTNCGLKVCD